MRQHLGVAALTELWSLIKGNFARKVAAAPASTTVDIQLQTEGAQTLNTATIPAATTTTAGVFTAADKSKLDGIAEGADKSDAYTKAEVDERLNGKASFSDIDDMAVYVPKYIMDAALAQQGIATPLDYANAKTLMANAGMSYNDDNRCANILAMAEIISALCAQIDANATTAEGKADATHTHAIADTTGLQAALDSKANTNGYYTTLAAGAADALMVDPSESTWATRTSTGSGMARVESVQGAAVSWNQLALTNGAATTTRWGLTTTMDPSTGIVTIAGTATQSGNLNSIGVANTQGHKYLIFGNSSDASMVRFSSQSYGSDDGNGVIITNHSANEKWYYTFQVQAGAVDQAINVTLRPQVYDLTAMFGAGNEPTTVAEFERMFPEPYYPYSAPTLKPVQIAGIASTDAQGGELDSVEWTAQTLRAAGSVADMLYSDHVDVRVGAYTFTGSETASMQNWRPTDTTYGALFPLSMISDRSSRKYENNLYSAAVMADLDNQIYSHLFDGSQTGFTMATDAMDTTYSFIVRVPKTIASTQAELMSWLAGKTVWYELATPATTPISPALPMTYRIEQGGTESIVVPEGEISAAPLLTVAEGESAADVVMGALAAIAAPDGPVATANHAVGTYLTMGGKLYRVTGAIAVGESIVAGTNVSQTTVMDDTRIVVLEYGVSTWDDFLAAYEANRIVYCRVSYSGGFRMAFLAFRQTKGSTAGAEFQYYRSRDAHTDGSQGDEVYIYNLSPNGTWTTTVRNAYTRIVAGDGLKSTYADGVLTISLDQ